MKLWSSIYFHRPNQIKVDENFCLGCTVHFDFASLHPRCLVDDFKCKVCESKLKIDEFSSESNNILSLISYFTQKGLLFETPDICREMLNLV